MMKDKSLETITGLIVLLISVGLSVIGYHNVTFLNKDDTYQLYALFSSAEGIKTGTDVMIAGIRVGRVVETTLDKESFSANVKIALNKDIEIPTDSSIKIASEGLMGGKFLQIAPGSEERMLKSGEKISYSQSGINLEQMITKYMFSTTNNTKPRS